MCYSSYCYLTYGSYSIKGASYSSSGRYNYSYQLINEVV